MKTMEICMKIMRQKTVLCIAAVLTVSCVCINARGTQDEKESAAGGVTGVTVPDGSVTFTAQIVMFGSVPRTFPGLVTSGGKQYSLKMAPDGPSMPELLSHTGEELECTGKIELSGMSGPGGFETLKDGTFMLYSYRILRAR